MLWDIIERFYATVGITLRLRLSLHDAENRSAYMGSDKQWADVEDVMRNIAKSKVGDDFEETPGDAAFYGPKLDFLGKDAIGREHQVATVQFDFNQPEGFDLTCINEESEQERIVMVHCATMGSLERFLSVFIEHTAGRFPVWCAPEQIRVLTVNQTDEIVAVAQKIVDMGKEIGLRVVLDNSKESVGKKIRESELWKVPYVVVVGEKEAISGEVTPRVRSDMQVAEASSMKVENFLKSVANEAKARVSKSSL